jgi:diketogulonate reductase-like aldo/keto reductase
MSNFTPRLLQQALALADIACVHVEYHAFLAQDELLALARRHRLALTAYSPLAQGRVLNDPALAAIGRQYDKDPAQVTLRWLVQQEPVAAIPRSAAPEHRAAKLRIFDFALSEQEMNRVGGLARGERLIDPSFAPAR